MKRTINTRNMRHDPLVGWVLPYFEQFYGIALHDIHEVGQNDVDIADIARTIEIEVKECTDRLIKQNVLETLDRFYINNELKKYTHICLDLAEVKSKKFPYLSKIDEKEILELLVQIEIAGVNEVHFCDQYRIYNDGIWFCLQFDSWDKVNSTDILPDSDFYVNSLGVSLHPAIIKLRNLFGPALSSFGQLDTNNNKSGGWSFGASYSGEQISDCNDYVKKVLQIVGNEVSNYDNLIEKYSSDSHKALCLIVDSGVPGLMGILNRNIGPFLPDIEPEIDPELDELIIVNNTLKVFIVWNKLHGWKNFHYKT